MTLCSHRITVRVGASGEEHVRSAIETAFWVSLAALVLGWLVVCFPSNAWRRASVLKALMNGSCLLSAMASTSSTTLRPALMPPRMMLAEAASVQPSSTTSDLSGGALARDLVAVIVYLTAVAGCVA